MTHDEVTAAMKAEDAWIEKGARGWWDWGATMRKATGHSREWDELDEDERALVRSRVRTALAAVLPHFAAVVAANTLEDAAENLDLPGSTAVGYYASEAVGGYNDAERDIEAWLVKRAAHIRAEAARLTTAEEPTT